MVDISVFELVDIVFDNPGKSKKDAERVKKELDRVIAEKRSVLNNTSDPTNSAFLRKQIGILEAAKQEFFTGDKLSDTFFTLCAQRTEKAKESLIELIELLSEKGKKTMSVKAVKGISRKQRLDYSGTVAPLFKPSGPLSHVKVEEINLNRDYPKFPSNGKKIHDMLSALRNLGAEELNGNPSAANVKDLYCLAAYFDKNEEKSDDYRKKPTKELFGLFDQSSKKYQLAGASQYTTFCQKLSAEAKIIFKDDASRATYDAYLLYRDEKLQEVFDRMHRLSEEMLRDGDVIRSCIDQILLFFSKVETAYAIYNKEAGLEDDPVEPEFYLFTILCGYCHTLNYFNSEADAQNAPGCKSCKRPLYKVCPKCKRKSPLDSVKCTNSACGAFFPDEQRFKDAMTKAETALEAGLLDEARQYLAEAKAADPTETVRTKKLEAAVKAKEGLWTQALNELKGYIGSRRFKVARQFAATLPTKYPGINIAKQSKLIDGELSRCDSMYEAAKRQDPLTRANTMVDILDICSDYSAAADYLKSVPPSASTGLWADADVGTGGIELGWNAPKERGVTFRILRKAGSAPSANPQDGTVLADGIDKVSFVDSSVILGTTYTYTVYSVRRGVYSFGVSAKAVSLKGVSDVSFTQNGNRIHLSWARPVNCASVTVYRDIGGKKALLSRSAVSSIDDTLDYGVQAVYHIVPNYPALAEKATVRFPIRIIESIDRFAITASLKNRSDAEVKWDIKKDGISIRIFLNGQEVKTVQSDPGYCTIPLPGDGVFTISAKAMTGGVWKDCVAPVTVSQLSVPACEVSIDEKISDKVTITVRPISVLPAKIDRIEAFIRKKNNPDDRAPWIRQEAAAALTADIIIPASSNQPGVKPFNAEDEDRYYVSVFAVYKTENRELYSEPLRKALPRPLIGNISWEIKSQLFKGKTLNIVIRANRNITERPAMKLCIAQKGRFLLSANHPDAILVLDIPKRTVEEQTTLIRESFEIPSGANRGMPAFLFLADKEKNETISISWQDGFNGNMA